MIGLGVLPSLLKQPGACEWVDDIEEGLANVGSVSPFTATGGSITPTSTSTLLNTYPYPICYLCASHIYT